MVELNKEAKECLIELLRNKTDEQESNKGGEDMDKFECLAGGKKCTNCGCHETSMAICATEDSVGNKFLGWIPKEREIPQGTERRTGVTIKKE